MKKTQQLSYTVKMENLTKSFKAFLDSGARENLLSEEFRHDVETQMGEFTETEYISAQGSYRDIQVSEDTYAPDHELADSEAEDDKSSAGSYNDPLNDETRSVLGDLERIVTEADESSPWEGSSHVIWSSPGIYPCYEDFVKAKCLLKSVIKSINRDSGSSYLVNVGRPDTLFVTRGDSLTISKCKGAKCKARSPSPTVRFDDDIIKPVIDAFAKGIKLKDKDEPDKFLTVSTKTPGFSEDEVRKAPLRFIKIKNTIEVQAPSSGLEYEYPSDYFKDKRKPQLVIKSIYKNLVAARSAFINSLRSSTPDLDAGKEFAYLYLDSVKMTNTSDWESYGVRIAAKDEEINVWNLFEVDLKTANPPANAVTGGEVPDPDVGLLIMFCSIYRMGSIYDTNYQGQISTRIMTQAVGLPEDIPNPDSLISLVGNWLTDVNYLKMIAGIDMFLHRFPKAPFATVRIGTIPSRYKDCASLLSIRFFLHIIGSENLDDVPAWITYEPIALNLIRMSKVGEEASEDASYFPYQSDLGLVRKSAYSTVVNPSYFFFVHGVGALLGLERSRNARMILEYGISGTVANVFLVAYIHKRNHIQALQFTHSGESVLIEGENQDTETDGITIRSNSPTKWARFMASREWVMTNFMKETIKRMQAELIEGESRPGTIGE